MHFNYTTGRPHQRRSPLHRPPKLMAARSVRYMRQLAEAARAPLPLADLAFNHLLTAAAIGHSCSDWGAIALAVRHAAGLPVPPPGGAGGAAGPGGGAAALQGGAAEGSGGSGAGTKQ